MIGYRRPRSPERPIQAAQTVAFCGGTNSRAIAFPVVKGWCDGKMIGAPSATAGAIQRHPMTTVSKRRFLLFTPGSIRR